MIYKQVRRIPLHVTCDAGIPIYHILGCLWSVQYPPVSFGGYHVSLCLLRFPPSLQGLSLFALPPPPNALLPCLDLDSLILFDSI